MTATGTPTEHGEAGWLVGAAAALLGIAGLLVAAGVISAAVFGGGLAVPHRAAFGTIVRGTLADPARPEAGWPAPLIPDFPEPSRTG